MSYKPKYLNQDEYETFVSTVEVFIRTGDNDAISDEQVAQNMDDLFGKVNNPQLERLKQLFKALKFYSRFKKGKHFKKLSIKNRQSILDEIQNPGFVWMQIEKLPFVGGVSKDLIRGLKVLCSVGYYSSPEAKKQVGYIPFEERASTNGKVQTPITFKPLRP